ncbi:adenylate/guanylate cyclase domain-containing protein [Tateyamaria omphalii]|uniref:adenylate/guanylate cyclase domain-containing protein n=1 Tax=Tateyamaria omphalii TaxID=299262 RepID=UPI001C9971D2|nr:adenylate/guanylate cyclase domain-containing protein [Tateyamaria omphalii]MBY5934742.1 adenylate/guanylate cyclase domain-containing protein [Tateyamaria omphalii]
MHDAAPFIDWILTAGRLQGPQALTDGLALRLRAAGIPLMRLRIGIRTTHPMIAAVSHIWDPGGNDAEDKAQLSAPHGIETRDTYIGSPMEIISTTQAPYRRRLDGTLGPDDHLILHELKARGATDWYGRPMLFATGSFGIIIFAADGAGFSAEDIALLDTVSDVLAPVVEAQRHDHMANAIAKSYLGPRTGQRVLDGQITRGDIEQIEAAILFSDIRGWTALNATQPAEKALDVANRYFEVMSDAIDNNGGEILKFMGDGILALFPSDGGGTGRVEACRQALSAAHAALGIAALADLPVPFGTGIHYGKLLYGNVGARERLDFTVLGQSVNIASRVEAFCGRLGEPILLSDTVAQLTGMPTRHVATEILKGMDTPMRLHAPANS